MFLAALAVLHLSCLRDRGQLYATLDTLRLEFLSIIREFYACMVHISPSLFTGLFQCMVLVCSLKRAREFQSATSDAQVSWHFKA